MHKAAIQQNSSQFITISGNFFVELTAQPFAPGVPLRKPLNLSGMFVNNKGVNVTKPLNDERFSPVYALQRNWVSFALQLFKSGRHPIHQWPIWIE
jgi:hypothetical protein